MRSLLVHFCRGSLLTLFVSVLAQGAMAQQAGAQAAPADASKWQPLFDGKTLGKWESSKFTGEGAVKVENGQIVLETGRTLTGITWTGPELPQTNYEIAFQAMRVEGRDF